jgi:repressor of nif and glnA expression
MVRLKMEECPPACGPDRIVSVMSRIENLTFQTTFDPQTRQGNLPVNVSLFPKGRLKKVLESMKPAFEVGLCVSDQIALAEEGERLGDIFIPPGRFGMATVSSIVIGGLLLKNGIPMDSKFGGLLEMNRGVPLRFVELIYYSGSSLNPSEVFIQGRMTSLRKVSEGRGNVLANFREIPSPSLVFVRKFLDDIRNVGIDGVLAVGDNGEAVCQTPVGSNRIGMVIADGLNPVALAQEMGVEAESYAISTIMDYQSLSTFSEICANMRRKNLL